MGWRVGRSRLLLGDVQWPPGFHKEVLEIGHHPGITFRKLGRDLVARDERFLIPPRALG